MRVPIDMSELKRDDAHVRQVQTHTLISGVIHQFLVVCLLSSLTANCATPVKQQLETLVAAAQGKRIGLITNPSGCDETGALDADYLVGAPGVTVSAFFAPEHGLRGSLPPGQVEPDYIDPQTGIPVYAVYKIRNAPTDAQLATVDMLVFDLQDVGVRFYTFVWTMTYCMEAAARNGKPFYIIDRPNPIGGMRVEGAPNWEDYGLLGRLGPGASFCVATRHGMTVGEIAWMWNENWMSPKVDLHVIRVPGWTRDQWWTDTGRVFVRPSPNMRTPACATVYPGTCIFEACTDMSEGRGTDKPFEYIGSPYINGTNYANLLNALNLPGVFFNPIRFKPTTSKFQNVLCNGVEVIVSDRDAFDPIRTGLHMLKVASQIRTTLTITTHAGTLMGVPDLDNRIRRESVDSIIAGWQTNLAQFRAFRSQYLLYPERPSFTHVQLGSNRNEIELTWGGAVNGARYSLFKRDSLDTPWTLLNDYTATGSNISVTNLLTSPECYFRLEVR